MSSELSDIVLKFCQFNVGLLMGPCIHHQKKKEYVKEGFSMSLNYFIPKKTGYAVPKFITERFPPLFSSPEELAEGIASFVNENDIDILSLNECDRIWPVNLYEFLKENTSLNYGIFCSCYRILPFFDNGNVLLSKYPVCKKSVIYLDPEGIYKYLFSFGRRALFSEVDLGFKKLDVIVTHFNAFYPAKRVKELMRIFSLLRSGSYVLMGDLNATQPRRYDDYGDDDSYHGNILKMIESSVDKNAHPDWYMNIFDYEQDFAFGTYPVVVNEDRSLHHFNANRFLDYILLTSKNEDMEMINFKIHDDVFLSDHFPVTSKIKFKVKHKF